MKRRISFMLWFSVFIVGTALLVVAASKEFEVGDREGWRVPDGNDTNFYDDWASRKRFHVGDTLGFNYQNDSVLVVDKYGYYHCVVDSPISSSHDGNTTVTLHEPGLIYFISGDIEHCKNGQRLIVGVMSPHDHSFASPPGSDIGISPEPSPNSGAVIPMTVILVLLSMMAVLTMLLWCVP
ncbi:hypothetical protein Droror1_Dr00006427 [Drosera rotundifolia]